MRRSFISKFICLTALAIITIMPVLAEENVISAIVISKSKNKVNSYELNIESSDASAYKMTIEDNNNIYFDIKNATLSEDLATYYNEASNIDNVVVRQLNHNKVRIYVQGKNVRNTALNFPNSIVENITPQEKKVIINRPIEEYMAVSNEDLDDMGDIQEWSDNSFNLAHLLSYLKKSNMVTISAILLVLLMLIGFIKVLSKKIIQEEEPLIGLNSQKINIKEENDELENISRRSRTIQKAQQELSIAHQKYHEYLQNKNKIKTNISPITKGVALNQYQKSTQNPYLNQEVIKMNTILQNQKTNQNNYKIAPKSQLQNANEPLKKTQSKTTSPYVQKTVSNSNNTIRNAKTGNLKFLESVSKIYENSGRSDLADELKNSIAKAKQSI